MDARNYDQAFYADGTREVQELVRMAGKIRRIHSQKLPKRGLPTNAPTHFS